jgi:heme A synthase
MNYVLALHILGAFLTGAAAVGSIVALKKSWQIARSLPFGLGLLAVNQLITGIFLVFSSSQVSITKVCISGLIYFAIVGLVEYQLISKTTSQRIKNS